MSEMYYVKLIDASNEFPGYDGSAFVFAIKARKQSAPPVVGMFYDESVARKVAALMNASEL